MPFFLFVSAWVVLFFYCILLYNNLVRLKYRVRQSWAALDVALQQRHDELPKLLERCRHYTQFDAQLLNQLTEARIALSEAARAHNVGRIGELESQLRSLSSQIAAICASDPQLGTDTQLSHLLQRISTLENDIAAKRTPYNEAVNDNNLRIAQFPDALIANLFGLKSVQPLLFAEAEKPAARITQ